ncbi:MAG: AsmA-like C-terminal region-containing protein, partial [Acetobacteraceae bacterium]
SARLAAPRLATTLHWLEAAAPQVLPPLPPDAVRQATLSARVTVNADQVALDNLKGTIDQSRVGGGISFGLGKGAAISAGLTFDRLDLDPWLAGAPSSLVGFSRLLGGGSIQLRLAAQQATLGQETISGLALDAAATPGQLIVRRLDATIQGTHAIASGTIGANGAVTAASLALTAPNPALLARLLPGPLGPALAHWPAAFSLSASAAGPPKRLKLKIDATLGSLRFTSAPILDVPAGAWQGTLTLRYPDAARLIAKAGLTDRTSWLGPGSFSLITRAAGTPSGLRLKNFHLIAGTLAASGHLDIVSGPPFAGVNGNIHANILPLPLPGANATEPLPFGIFSGWRGTVGFSANQAFSGDRVLLRDVSGRISDAVGSVSVLLNGNPPGGGALAASLELNTAATPPAAKLGAAFQGIVLKGGLGAAALDLASGTIEGKIALDADGYSPAAMLATLGGTVQLEATNGEIEGLRLGAVREVLSKPSPDAAEPRLAAALSGGATRFEQLDLQAKAATGRFVLDTARMRGPAGQLTARGTFDLPAQSLDVTLTVKPAIAGAPPITVRLAGPAANPERLIEGTAALEWLAAHRQHPAKPTKSRKPAPTARGAAGP